MNLVRWKVAHKTSIQCIRCDGNAAAVGKVFIYWIGKSYKDGRNKKTTVDDFRKKIDTDFI